MADRPEQALVPSLLDRLIDDDPAKTTEAVRDRATRLADLKVAVRRDLEDLLNTRRRLTAVPAGRAELARSLVTYGLADVSGQGPATGQERLAFARQIERVLADADPRLTRVEVELVPTDDTTRTLKFRITALLRVDPAPEPVAFDSTLDAASGQFLVGGGS